MTPRASAGGSGKLLPPCSKWPNCASTEAAPTDARHFLPPLPYLGTRSESERRLRIVLAAERGLRLLTARDDRWHAEVRSRFLRLVDDLDVRWDDDEQLVQMRSASRIGRYDFGVNRRRLQRISRRYLGDSEE